MHFHIKENESQNTFNISFWIVKNNFKNNIKIRTKVEHVKVKKKLFKWRTTEHIL